MSERVLSRSTDSAETDGKRDIPSDEVDQSRPRKAPRLYHTKSKNGCIRCRTRRVKCDEDRPVCGGCRRHKVPCSLENCEPITTPQKRLSASEQTATELETLAILTGWNARSMPTHFRQPAVRYDSSTDSLPESRARRTLELRLIHNFLFYTCKTFYSAQDEEIAKVWTVDALPVALEYNALLYSILAISARHLLVSEPDNTELKIAHLDLSHYFLPSFFEHGAGLLMSAPQACSYGTAAAQEHRKDVAQLNPATANAVCITSSINRMEAFSRLQDRSITPYKPPVEWMHLMTGVASVFKTAFGWIKDDNTTIAYRLIHGKPSLTNLKDLFKPSNREGLLYLLNHKGSAADDEELLDEGVRKTYEMALSYVGSMLQGISDGETPLELARRVMGFAFVIPAPYFERVEQGKSRALVILAYFFAIVAGLKEVWWIGNVGFREVRGIQSVLPDIWQDAMRWPLNAIANFEY